MSDQPPFAEYPRPDQGGFATYGRGPGVYFEAIGEAWNLVMKDIGHWIAATIVYFVVAWALSLPISLLTQSMMPRNPRPEEMGKFFSILGLQFALNLIPSAVSSVMMVGMFSMGVRKARGEYINVGMIFEPFRRFGSVFGANLLYWVICFAAALACFVPSLFFAPVLILMPLVAFQKGLTPFQALSLTFDRCKAHWAGLLGLGIVLWLITVAGVLVCCVGTLVAWPIVCVTLAIHYRAFFESEPAPVPAYQ